MHRVFVSVVGQNPVTEYLDTDQIIFIFFGIKVVLSMTMLALRDCESVGTSSTRTTDPPRRGLLPFRAQSL
jgi:hypothetical protein